MKAILRPFSSPKLPAYIANIAKRNEVQSANSEQWIITKCTGNGVLSYILENKQEVEVQRSQIPFNRFEGRLKGNAKNISLKTFSNLFSLVFLLKNIIYFKNREGRKFWLQFVTNNRYMLKKNNLYKNLIKCALYKN